MGTSLKRNKQTVATYAAICQTFLQGVVRLVDAEVAFTFVMHGFTTYQTHKGECKSGNEVVAEMFTAFDHVKIDQFWAAQYVNAISGLVYSASLFDTFLNESTIFLFLLIPDAIGKSYQVPLRSLIDAESRGSILTGVAQQRARDISSKTFRDRLSFLRETFGLPIALPDKTLAALEHFTTLRNSAVHDQGFLALKLEDSGKIKHTIRASRHFPTDLVPKDATTAEKTFRFVALTVANDIFIHILKVKSSAIPAYLEKFMKQTLSGTAPEL